MPATSYPDSYRLPENKKLIERLNLVSIFIGITIGIASTVALIGWLINIPILQKLFIGSINIALLTTVAFIFSAAIILLEGQIEKIKNKNNSSKYIHTFTFFISITLSILITGIGLLYLSDFFSINKYFSQFLIDGGVYTRETLITCGICIFIVGIAFMTAKIPLKYHFHVVHFLALIVLTISTLNILDNIYQALSPLRLQFTYLPLNVAIILLLLSIAIAFRWPSKGFIGIFTTEAVSTIYTLRLLFLNILIIAFLGLVSLAGARAGLYSSFESVAVFAVLIMVIATILAWLNIKLLYRFELERYAMREQLRAHNIELKLGNEELANKMEDLKKTNEEYKGKLNFKEIYQDVIENSE